MLVCEYPAVNELLHLVDVDDDSSQCIYGSVLPVSDDSQKHVVWGDAVAARSHSLFAREVDDRIQFV